MIYARLWGTQNDYHDVTSIWSPEPDGKNITGPSFWKLEGGSFSFECALDGYIAWLMNREINDPYNYQIKYGIRKCYVQIYRDNEQIADGYLQSDSFELQDKGNQVNGQKIELVKIKVYDLLSCIFNYVKNKTYSLTAGSYPYLAYDIIRSIITGINQEGALLWGITMFNNWSPLSNFPYNYNNFPIYNLNYVNYAPLPYPWAAVHLQRTLSYIIVQNHSPFPIMTAVRWAEYEAVSDSYGNPDGQGNSFAWYETIHFIKAELRGAQAVVIQNTTDNYLHISGEEPAYEIYELLRRHTLPSLAYVISIYQSLILEGRRWVVSGEELQYTGSGYIDQVVIGETGDYNAEDVVSVLLNVLYGWLDCTGHGIRLKNKLPVSWQQTDVVVIEDAGELTSNSTLNEPYQMQCEWLASKDAILAAINNYYHDKVAGLLYELQFTTCEDILPANYFSVRGWLGYVTGVKPISVHTPEKQVTGFGIRLEGSNFEEVITLSANSYSFETIRNIRSDSQVLFITGHNIREALTLTCPTVTYPPSGGDDYAFFYLRLLGEEDWEQELVLTPNSTGDISVEVEMSFLPTLSVSGYTGALSLTGQGDITSVVLEGNTIKGTFEQESGIVYTDWHSGYSLRKLRADYSGICMTICANDTNTPEYDIGFDDDGNIDVATLETYLGSGNMRVKYWYNQAYNASSNPNVEQKLTNSTVTERPFVVYGGAIVRDAKGNVALKFESGDNLISTTTNWRISGVLDGHGMFCINSVASGGTGDTDLLRFSGYVQYDGYWYLKHPGLQINSSAGVIKHHHMLCRTIGDNVLTYPDNGSFESGNQIRLITGLFEELTGSTFRTLARIDGAHEYARNESGAAYDSYYNFLSNARGFEIGGGASSKLINEALVTKRILTTDEVTNAEIDMMDYWEIT